MTLSGREWGSHGLSLTYANIGNNYPRTGLTVNVRASEFQIISFASDKAKAKMDVGTWWELQFSLHINPLAFVLLVH